MKVATVVFRSLFFPLTFAKKIKFDLDGLKHETIRVVNGLSTQAPLNASDYGVRVGIIDGFTIFHKKTGNVLASTRKIKYKHVQINEELFRSRLFPDDFAKEVSDTLKTTESLYFWHEENKANTVILEISIDPVFHEISFGILSEYQYHNTIKVFMDGDLNISKTHKEIYDFGEMYGSEVESTTYPSSKPLSEIFVKSNGFINDKATPGKTRIYDE